MQPLQVGIADGMCSHVVTIRELTPLEELLGIHPAPWQCVQHPAWKGKDLPDPIIYDARWDIVDLCDDPRWRCALVQAVNVAASVLCSIDDVNGAIRAQRECGGK
jgi:hypothetical protein